jgi:hypothetical protein
MQKNAAQMEFFGIITKEKMNKQNKSVKLRIGMEDKKNMNCSKH